MRNKLLLFINYIAFGVLLWHPELTKAAHNLVTTGIGGTNF